ncbi:MAG: zinc-ribbon domain-containing protein, partial [Candidatus Lokiarchaeota archaeon]|nr:zinc-ribbon domain-containing protein [Candidatus Lokiarchaeota archaeon]MBD3199248.1 zinc-ribbon domain-containing protein [Candidatus Lokiarchaeota archaeon]
RVLDPHWWLFNWWHLIFLFIGLAIIGSQIGNYLNRGKLRRVVKQEFIQNPNATVEEISSNTGITIKDVRAIILDLKASGQLRGQFSSSTGKMKYTQVQHKGVPISPIEREKTADAKPETTEEKRMPNYCPACGTPVSKEGSRFCQYCGNKLE